MIKQSILIASLVGLLMPAPMALAAEMTTLRDSFAVMADTPLDSQKTEAGSPFQGTLSETLTYHGEMLPQGTQFVGHITEVDQSKRFGRPAHIDVSLDKVVFPDGKDYQFTEKEQASSALHVSNSDKNITGLVKSRIPYSIAELSAKGGFLLVTNLSVEEIVPIAMGAEMLTGIVKEFRDKTRAEESTGRKIVNGAYHSSWLYQAMNFVKKEPEMNMPTGQSVYVHFRPNTMLNLLSHPESI